MTRAAPHCANDTIIHYLFQRPAEMAGSTTKKVQIWRFDRETLTGFANPVTYLTDAGVELLTLAGNVVIANYSEVKAVFFVREFDSADVRRTFLSRPKLDGLWLRLTFRDGGRTGSRNAE